MGTTYFLNVFRIFSNLGLRTTPSKTTNQLRTMVHKPRIYIITNIGHMATKRNILANSYRYLTYEARSWRLRGQRQF